MKLIVGLGNPGKEYENTRHNMGFMVLDYFLNKHNIVTNKTKFGGIYYEDNLNGTKVLFLKPQNYINLSGEVIKKFIDFFKININDILIIHDDLDTPCGSIKLRVSGGSGGHNGLKNIEQQLKTKDYKRIKLGISNNKMVDTKDYVLGKFSCDEKKTIDVTIQKVSDILDDYISDVSFDNLMNKYN